MYSNTYYFVRCDVPGCARTSQSDTDPGGLKRILLAVGWELREVEDPNGPEVLFPIEIFRCLRCTRADKKPLKWDEGWTPEVVGGTQG